MVEIKLVNVDFSISKNSKAWKGPSASVLMYRISISGFFVVTDKFLKRVNKMALNKKDQFCV